MRALWLVLLCAGCVTGEPFRFPSTSLQRQPVVAHADDVEILVEPITRRNWQDHPSLKALVKWDEPALYWGLTTGGPREIEVPLVPLPSFVVTIVNRSKDPVDLADAQIAIADDEGRMHPIYEDPTEFSGLVTAQLTELREMAWLRFTSLPGWGHRWAPWFAPIRAVNEAVANVRLFGPSVHVEPGETWNGALVAKLEAESPVEVARILRGKIGITVSGARLGDRRLATTTFAFAADAPSDHVVCADGASAKSPADCAQQVGFSSYHPDGPCMQLGTERVQFGTRDLRLLDGKRVSDGDVYETLLSTPESREKAKKARALRIAGYTLLGAGIVGGAAMAGGIATVNREDALAGLSGLGLSIVGAGLIYGAHKKELEAVRDFNQFAFVTGACASPL